MTRLSVAVLAGFVLTMSCRKDGDEAEDAPPPLSSTLQGKAVVPNGAEPPFGVTWRVGFNQNMPFGELEAWYARLVALSSALWNVTEGQVYITRVVLEDNVGSEIRASALMSTPVPPAVRGFDAIVFGGNTWNVQFGGFVAIGATGREGRIIGLPSNPNDLVILHEGSHMLFRLSWSMGPLLWDEYADGTQDNACVMELAFSVLRWCGEDNHVGQASQPTSCWTQILTDYPFFRYSGLNKAADPAPSVEVEYNDVP
ncbi:MAG: hypothetical protein HYY16_03980 [Planctomycetes bacterium]|nr:hypothetical protein [Planctomycetota bacterium]